MDTAVTVDSGKQAEKQQTKVTKAAVLDTTVTIDPGKQVENSKEKL